MHIKFGLLLILLCIAFQTKAPAQNNAKLIPFYDKWPMMQDSQGYIWYVDNSGRIGKYLDGDRLSDADLFDEFAGCDYTNFIKEDIQGHIWMATGCRFYRFDPVRKKFEDIQQQILDQTKYNQSHTESWYEDTSGTVWFGGSALISYSLKTKKILVADKDGESGMRSNMRFNLFGGEGHTIWFSSTGNQGFNFQQYDPAKQKIIRTFNFDFNKMDLEGYMTVNVKTEKIIHGRPETYLVYIGARLFEFDAQAGTLISIPVPETFGKAIEIGNNGLYNYIGTDNGSVLRYLPASKNFELTWQHATKKPIEIIFRSGKGKEAFAYADNNLIPISTSRPLFKIVLDLTDSTLPRGYQYNLVNIHGRMYFKDREQLVPVFKSNGADTITFYPKILYPEDMNFFIGDIPGRNQFWQLVRYFPVRHPDLKPMLLLRDSLGKLIQTYQSTLLDSILHMSFVSSIMTDRKNNVWIIASRGGKICQFNIAENKFKVIVTDQDFMMSLPKIMVDSKSNLWISNSTSGLVRYDSEKENFRRFNFDPSDSNNIASNHVTVTYEAADGHIWMGTKNKGISVLDPGTGNFRQLNKLNGLPELTITDITESKNGVIWVATRQYICRWLPAQDRFVVYRNEDGLAFDASHGQNVFYSQNDGAMLVRTTNEILAFDPDSANTYQYPIPSILFTGFSIGNKVQLVGTADSILPRAINFVNHINLNYAQNKFTIRFAAVDFYGNVEYAYRLSGSERDWQYVKNKTEATYTNVPPGNYIFEVKVANHQGYWSEVRSLPITVRAPWYRTWLAYGIYALLTVLLLRTYFRFRSRKLIQANLILEDRISKRTNQLSDSLKELKETQNQMVQREKIVNNFSELNTELINELEQEIENGNLNEIKAITHGIKENEQKINHHGKRADAIVKGMLLHSRSSSGMKEPVDVNALCDEYLRLAYHGFRAKDKSFNATMKTDFDATLGKITIIRQDIGRVILNLINNAFYAVDEKKKQLGSGYEPTVSVTTRKINDKVEIKVSDNGNGIPDKVIDKIFQPFFTTKPTGEGTGLGLSLSYDIISKGHNGSINVDTEAQKGTTFTIQLPFDIEN
jgi:signal transduction histidine kinase/streptogramin lyase